MLSVNLEPDELRLHQLLRAYAQLVHRDEAIDRQTRHGHGVLAMTVLTKRALSSPASLRISIHRRIQLLSRLDAPDLDSQLVLPFTEEEHDDRDIEPLDILAAPGLSDRARELTILREIDVAASAVPVGRKVRALTRLLQRIKEPAIVFTEYRDTLQHVAAEIGAIGGISLIHGGLSETERVRARTAFVEGASRVLLATDAGGEGLNLHHRCRLVINLELPWNPIRLEQRIGRVDRLGQSRQVHAVNLFARGTSEEDILKRLVHRLARARQAVGQVNDPLGAVDDLTEVMFESDSVTTPLEPEPIPQPNLRDSALAEAKRLVAVRRLGLSTTRTDPETIPVVALRRSRLGGLISSPSLVCLLLARLISGDGELVEHVLIPLVAQFRSPVSLGPVIQRPNTLRTMTQQALDVVGSQLHARVHVMAEQRLKTISADYEAVMEVRRDRELSLIRAIQTNPQLAALVQPGLFDTRILRDHATALQSRSASLGDEVARIRRIERACEVSVADHARLALVLVVA
jgi:hypothetical protein